MRLRPLTEAECYTRCYGSRDERVTVFRDESELTRPAAVAEIRLRELVEQRLAALDDDGLEAA